MTNWLIPLDKDESKRFGSEAAIHAMHTEFEADDTNAVLLKNTWVQ